MTAQSAVLTADQLAEAERLSRYLIGNPCSMSDAADYFEAVSVHGATLNAQQQRLWKRMMRSGLLLRTVDAGLALTAPSSMVRKRIFIMFCILETSPRHVDNFLPIDRSPFYIMAIGLRAVRAVIAAVFGVAVVKVMGCD